MSSSVTFRPRARSDVLGQIRYLDERSGERTARSYYSAVLDACGMLSKHPLAGTEFPIRSARLRGLRRFPVQAPFQKYLIFYQRTRTGIDVVRILHGARDIEGTLEEE